MKGPPATRVCVLGNSHIAALKVAWDGMAAARPDMRLDFFGSKSQTLAETFVTDGVLTSADERVRRSLQGTGGSSEIPLRDYDAVLIGGAGLNFRLVGHLLAHASTYPERVGDDPLASKALLRETARRRVRDTAGFLVASRIAEAGGPPVFVALEPFVAQRGLVDETVVYLIPVISGGPDLMRFAVDLFETACVDAFSGFAAVLPQPMETREDLVFTRESFSTGAVALKKLIDERDADENDFVHKNAAYGALVLDAFLDGLAGASASAETLPRP